MNIPSILRHWFTLAATGLTAWLIAVLVLSADDQAALAKAIGDLVGPLVIIGTLVVTALWRVALTWMGKTFRAGAGENSSRPSGGMPPLVVVGLGLSMAAVGTLPSCSPGAGSPLSGTVSYRDPRTGAKGGLVFVPGQPVGGRVQVPIYDPQTGALMGTVDMASGK